MKFVSIAWKDEVELTILVFQRISANNQRQLRHDSDADTDVDDDDDESSADLFALTIIAENLESLLHIFAGLSDGIQWSVSAILLNIRFNLPTLRY